MFAKRTGLIVLALSALAVLPVSTRRVVATEVDADHGGDVAAVHYHTVQIDGVDVFYREAGPKDGPGVLLLHGFPASSFMFRNLIPQLATRYHVIAPDYPGYGQSVLPDHKAFQYTFDHLAAMVEQLTRIAKLENYTLYVQDYGAPVGYRIAVAHPERVTGIVVQNGNAYVEGLPDSFLGADQGVLGGPFGGESRSAGRRFDAGRVQVAVRHGGEGCDFGEPGCLVPGCGEFAPSREQGRAA